MCGTPNYIAPEILSCEGHSFEVDVWAFGVILFGLLVGRMPFETASLKNTYQRITNAIYHIPSSDSSIPDSARTLISQILVKNPHMRLT